MTDSSPIRKRPFWREYLFEIVLFGVILLGVFLLVERMDIRVTLRRWLTNAATAVSQGLGQAVQGLFVRIAGLTLSDLVGVLLIAAAVAAVLWRIRWRLTHDERFSADVCPVCGGPLHRIHRTRGDRIVGVFVPVRRHQCKDRACGWSGRRYGRSGKKRRRK